MQSPTERILDEAPATRCWRWAIDFYAMTPQPGQGLSAAKSWQIELKSGGRGWGGMIRAIGERG